MEVRLLSRPASQCCLSSTSGRTTSLLPLRPLHLTSRRHKSTSGRHRRSLNIQPHPSFLAPAGDSSTSSARAARSPSSHIVFNPPSSAPSVFHTPFKFLPKNDPRRRANLPSLFDSSTTIAYSSSNDGPDPSSVVLPSKDRRHNVTEADVAEIRRLRAADPVTNSVGALARRYDCSHLFIMMCCQAPAEHAERHREALERVKSRWGHIRTKAREDRQRRRDMIFRGEL